MRRSVAHRNCASPVRASAQNGDLFFVTNNVFKVKQEGCQQFEETWKNRESRLKDTPGFLRFALLRGDEEGEYISQTTWASRQAFKDWTQSQNISFAKAHGTSQGEQDKKPEHGSKRAGMAELLDGPPKPRCDLVRLVTDIPEFLPNAEQLNLLQGSANDQTAVLQSSSFQPKHKTAVHAAVHDQSDLRLKKVILNCAANAFKF
ncbi:hypothetical protein WJX79_002148 [Trebouxia sp. C0005]